MARPASDAVLPAPRPRRSHFCFALLRGYSVTQALMYAGLIGVFACLGSTDCRRRKFVSAITALGLVTCSAVLVALSGGVTEMHFHFFVIVSILTLYQDWLPFLLAIGFVVLHHAVLGILDPTAVFSTPQAIADPIPWALIHGGFVLAASVTSVVAWRLNEEQAFRDSLTTLPNRALFQDRVAHALARADRRPGVLAVLFIDLDRFKDVNDSLGHAAGDHLLCNVAERLRACIRSADTAARLGGDEFAILLEDVTSEDDALRAAQRVLDALAMPFMVGGRETTVSASIGIALNSRADTVDALLRNADVAMYKVKASGRVAMSCSRPRCTPRWSTASSSAGTSSTPPKRRIRALLPAVISLDTGRIVWRGGAASLAAPNPRPVGPGRVHRAGRGDRGDRSDRRLGHRHRLPAGQQMEEEPGRRPFHDFGEPVAGPAVRSRYRRYRPRRPTRSGLAPCDLVLELTEKVMLNDTALTARRLEELKALGVKLAIDDFGTGYSSLNYLRRLPFDILKIDKSFIDGIVDRTTDSDLTGDIINMARTLGLDTVAEGVERPEQVPELRRLGCHNVQGFLFAKPLPRITDRRRGCVSRDRQELGRDATARSTAARAGLTSHRTRLRSQTLAESMTLAVPGPTVRRWQAIRFGICSSWLCASVAVFAGIKAWEWWHAYAHRHRHRGDAPLGLASAAPSPSTVARSSAIHWWSAWRWPPSGAVPPTLLSGPPTSVKPPCSACSSSSPLRSRPPGPCSFFVEPTAVCSRSAPRATQPSSACGPSPVPSDCRSDPMLWRPEAVAAPRSLRLPSGAHDHPRRLMASCATNAGKFSSARPYEAVSRGERGGRRPHRDDRRQRGRRAAPRVACGPRDESEQDQGSARQRRRFGRVTSP